MRPPFVLAKHFCKWLTKMKKPPPAFRRLFVGSNSTENTKGFFLISKIRSYSAAKKSAEISATYIPTSMAIKKYGITLRDSVSI
jgi:hypothetical protein